MTVTKKSLGEATRANTLLMGNSIVCEIDGAVRRVTLGAVKTAMQTGGKGQITKDMCTQYTLEGSSSPAFTVLSRGHEQDYVAAMGGYMFLKKGTTVYAAKLDQTNWAYFADGTEVSNPALFETMIHVPDCHILGNSKTMYFGGLSPIADGHTFGSPHWVGAYQMDANGHSRPNVGSGHTKTMSAFWDLAQTVLGTGGGLANYGFHCLINTLFQVLTGNLNSQSVLTGGMTQPTGNYEAFRDLVHGKTISLGDGSGCVSAVDSQNVTRYVTKFLGFEDLFDKLWEFRPGIRFYMDNGTRKAVVYEGNVVSNTATGREFTYPLQSASGTYPSQMMLGEHWDMIPKNDSGGGEALYYCDGAYASTSGALPVVGGNAAHGAPCGLSSSNSIYAFDDSYSSIGARLAFYGEPEIVSGAELVAKAAE